MSTAEPPAEPPAPMRELGEVTVEWLDALLSSASVEVIGRDHWWGRAEAALVTAAAADTYSHAVSVACRKLQIETLSLDSSRVLRELAGQVSPRLQEWRRLAERDAPYLIALTRLRRDARRTARPAGAAAAPKPSVTPAEAMF